MRVNYCYAFSNLEFLILTFVRPYPSMLAAPKHTLVRKLYQFLRISALLLQTVTVWISSNEGEVATSAV